MHARLVCCSFVLGAPATLLSPKLSTEMTVLVPVPYSSPIAVCVVCCVLCCGRYPMEWNQDTLGTFEVAATLGEEALGAQVISMASSPSDVLAVKLMQASAT